MKNEILRAQSVLSDLEKFTSRENVISSLTTLNEIISSSQEEIEFLYKSNGLDTIVALLERDCRLSNICLKILANASMKDKNVRGKLLESNIFRLLAGKLQNETDFSTKNLIFYFSLIVALVHGNHEAQDQMRISGCLSSIVYIMSTILDETETESLPPKSTELIIYSMIASSKEPRHRRNQTEIGWITPKILEYLGKLKISPVSDQLQVIKCFWSFLKAILDKNELNQKIFLDSFGLSIVFSSIQEVLEERNCPEMEDLLVKITGVLVKLKSHKGFLSQASNYCPLMILCSLLKTCNILVVQQTVIFLESLSREFPQVLQLLRSDEISNQIKKTNLILLKSQAAAQLCQNLWNRMLFHQAQNSQNLFNNPFGCSPESVSSNFRELILTKPGVCVVHDADQVTSDSQPFPSSTPGKRNNENLSQVRFPGGYSYLHRKVSREREKNFKKAIAKTFFPLRHKKGSRFNIVRLGGRGIVNIFRKLLFFFVGVRPKLKNRNE